MTEDVKAKIFEPFFTTKGPDSGTGLGLATVHGIVHQAGGSIAVDSEPGRGTAFVIDFPAIAAAPTPVVARGWSSLVPRATLGRGRLVLLVEDEDAVRTLARITLESQGYAVTEAADAETALALFNPEERLDLLVTDLTMPGMDGQELAELSRASSRTRRRVHVRVRPRIRSSRTPPQDRLSAETVQSVATSRCGQEVTARGSSGVGGGRVDRH